MSTDYPSYRSVVRSIKPLATKEPSDEVDTQGQIEIWGDF